MASEVLGPNSLFSKRINYADHLLENHILDDVEPQYENGDIIRKLLQKNNSFSKSLMAIHEEVLSTKAKEENIYENIENCLNDAKYIKPMVKFQDVEDDDDEESDQETVSVFNGDGAINDSEESDSNTFTSTFSLTIGKPLNIGVKNDVSETKPLYIDTNNTPEVEEEDSDDASFKSSYAKSLIDSLKKTSISPQTSPVEESSFKLTSPPAIQEEVKPFVTFIQPIEKDIASIQNSSMIYLSKNANCSSPKSVDQLEKRISSLTDNVLMKDKELEKLKQEILLLKMECHRVKAENRSLKSGLSNGVAHTRANSNGDSQPASLSSLSIDSDTWTLQQQVSSLNSQLEKAELSRHAYEAATKQLVHFLQTINTTLTTVAGPDTKMASPFTPQNTSELLTNLELSLLQNRLKTSLAPPRPRSNPYFESNKDGSFIAIKPDSPSPVEYSIKDHSHKDQSIKDHLIKDHLIKDHSHKDHSTKDHSLKDISPSPSERKPKYQKHAKESKSVTPDRLSPFSTPDSALSRGVDAKERGRGSEGKAKSPQRRFSISNKIWHSAKKNPLMRSGSVSNLPSDVSTPLPRVSRAVSTHCVSSPSPLLASSPLSLAEGGDHSDRSSETSNRLRSSKAKEFFSSLRNIFRNEERPPCAAADPALALPPAKKKLTLPSLHRSGKVKVDPSPLSLPPASAPQTNLKKRHSLKLSTLLREAPPIDALRNSVFYVPRITSDDVTLEWGASPPSLSADEGAPLSSSSGSSSSSSSAERSTPTTIAEEMSGPQEMSVALTMQQDTPTLLGAQATPPLRSEATPPIEPQATPPVEPQATPPSESEGTASSSGARSLRLGTGGRVCTEGACESVERSTLGAGGGGGGVTGVQSFSTPAGVRGSRGSFSTSGGGRGRGRGAEWAGIQRRRSDFDAIRIKHSLWKLSRESFRAKQCRLAFV